MNYHSEKLNRAGSGLREIAIGLFVSFVLFCCFYPNLALFKATPMHSAGWELSDSAVSGMNFQPSFKVFQHELYNNHNVLWSSMRAMGMPILANDIQAAPLFPLTLLLSGLDESTFWNAYVLSRILLMGLGTYLLLRRFFNFQRLPSIFFILSFIYTLYVMRWMNNPWQNGLLAGVWYLYFLCLVSEQSGDKYTVNRFFVFLGLVLSVFSMVTCGFPESAVMSAILVVLVYVPFIFSKVKKKQLDWRAFSQDLLLAHIVGFSFSAYQIFSIIELLSLSESFRYVGFNQYPAADLIPFFAENLTAFNDNVPALFADSRTFFGLIPVTFFLIGVEKTVFGIRKLNYGQIGALGCGLFMVFKLFAVGPAWFNTVISKPPILHECYFFVYFFSIFLWFFSYFAALGFQEFLYPVSVEHGKSIRHKWMWIVVNAALVLILLIGSAYLVSGKSILQLLVNEHQFILLEVLLCFFLSLVVCYLYLKCSKRKNLRTLLAILLLMLAVWEHSVTLPKKFSKNKADQHVQNQVQQLLTALDTRNMPLVESRLIDQNGTYITQGLATIDTGATPLLPIRTKAFRTNLFQTGVGGHLPIEYAKSDFSWDISSTNIKALDRFYGAEKEAFPDWKNMQRLEGENIHFDVLKYNGNVLEKKGLLQFDSSDNDLFYLSGWAFGAKENGAASSSVYIVFKNQEHEFVVPTRKKVRHDVVKHLGDDSFVMAGWDSYFSATVFPEGTYSILIRLVDTGKTVYYEYLTESRITLLSVDASGNQGKGRKGMDFIGMLERKYVYLDSSALPRAYIAAECDVFDSMEDVLTRFGNTAFKLGNVYIEELDDDEKAFCRAYESGVVRIPIVYDKGSELVLDKVTGPAIIVLNDNIYPGWQAIDTIQGGAIAIKPANITFRSLLLPENREYRIKFEYKPEWLFRARMIVALGILIVLISGIVSFSNTVKKRQPQNIN